MILDPLPDTRRARRVLPPLIAAAEHLRAVDHLARELMPCDHLPLLPPAGVTPDALDDLNIMADHLAMVLRVPRCSCRATANRQLVAGHQLAYTLWDRAYTEATYYTAYRNRETRRRLPAHVERLRRHRASFEQLVTAYRTLTADALETLAGLLVSL